MNIRKKKGDLTIRSAGDLYLYDNTLKAVKVKGSVIKDWIDMSAGKFNQITPNKTEEQELLKSKLPCLQSIDVIDGVQYQIDVNKTSKIRCEWKRDSRGFKPSC